MKTFSRKGAKTQRKTLLTLGLCAFAGNITEFLCKQNERDNQ